MISAGAMAMPAATHHRANIHGEDSSASGAIPRPITASISGNWRASGRRQLRLPYTSPPAALPMLMMPSRTPANAGLPDSVAYAVVPISTSPNAEA